MTAPFQIIPATPAEISDILRLEQRCFPRPWEERLVRSFVVAACLPKKGYLARVIMEGKEVVAYAFASQHEGQLLVERLGVRPENRRKGVGSGLMVSLILAARNWKLPAITCSVDEENLGGQLFLKVGGFKALPVTDEARREKMIQFARSSSG
ncbi:MAG: GNAT family N-acetyltransferase [Pirellulaceae bacterium]|nr:GNAT family N-acetyltransferase [Pirellulaceae bacterium]